MRIWVIFSMTALSFAVWNCPAEDTDEKEALFKEVRAYLEQQRPELESSQFSVSRTNFDTLFKQIDEARERQREMAKKNPVRLIQKPPANASARILENYQRRLALQESRTNPLCNSAIARLLTLVTINKYLENNCVKIEDRQLFGYITAQLYAYGGGWPGSMEGLRYFSDKMTAEVADEVRNIFLSGRAIPRFIDMLPASVLKIGDWSAARQVMAIRLRVSSVGRMQLIMLDARFGDPESIRILIAALDPSSKSQEEYRIAPDTAVRALLRLESQQANIALMKRYAGLAKQCGLSPANSQAYLILTGMYEQYPTDSFFVKYRDYFMCRKKVGVTTFPEQYKEGVSKQEFYADLRKWCRSRLDQDLEKITEADIANAVVPDLSLPRPPVSETVFRPVSPIPVKPVEEEIRIQRMPFPATWGNSVTDGE